MGKWKGMKKSKAVATPTRVTPASATQLFEAFWQDIPPTLRSRSGNAYDAYDGDCTYSGVAYREMETTAAATKGRNGRDRKGRDRNGGDGNNGRNRNNGKDRNNGGDHNNDRKGDRNGDAKNVQKPPRSSKKSKSVQERPRASKEVQERPSRAKTMVPEMYRELALLQEILDSINRHGSVGLASLPTAALIAQWSCFERCVNFCGT